MNDLDFGIYIELENLSSFAESAARLSPPLGTVSARSAVKELRQSFHTVRHIHDEVQQRYTDCVHPPEGCEWLLDNFYIIQREYKSTLRDLSGITAFRSCENGILALECCKTLIRTGHCHVDEQRCTAFLSGWQRVTVLERRELDLFPALLRTALISVAAKICTLMLSAADTKEYAELLSALFASLRLLAVSDPAKLTESADVVNAILKRDPTGDYAGMDSETRSAYLERLAELAEKEGISEASYAKALVKKAAEEGKHIGFFLFPPVSAQKSGLYIGANVLLTLFLSFLVAFGVHSAVSALLLLVPVSEVVKALLDFILLRRLRPRSLPRMDTEKGIPQEGRTLCVISSLIHSPEEAKMLAGRLEELRLASRADGDALYFGLLADLAGAESAVTQDDFECIAAAQREITALNGKYGSGFYLFSRSRHFDGEQYSAHERKRGALLELSRLLCDRENELTVFGERDALNGIRYILTLDSDTRIYPGSVSKLIGAALHPLCKPVLDHEKHIVRSGYGIVHPRMSTDLADANATDFTLIFAPGGGSDPYGSLCGELYMDAFGDGGFAGKGLIYAPALLECSQAHIPEGRILSHDAIEGAFLRGAFMGDTEFSDGFPAETLAYFKRQHRWTRGDWQNLPFLFRRGKELSAISRWRLFDSVRRSLVPPMTLAAILVGFCLPDTGVLIAAWAALAALIQRLFFSLAESGFARKEKIRLRRYTRLLTGVGGAIVQTFIRLWLLPYEAWVNLSAAFCSLWRMLVSGKKLLQWQTAAQSGGNGGILAHYRAMWFPAVLGAAMLFFSPLIIGRSAGLLWFVSPIMAAALSLPAHRETALSRQDRAFLLRTAQQNWQYFAELCTVEDNFLPPDNYQEQPPVGAAHRTSPTNIGLALASAVAAMDMSFIDERECTNFIRRITGTLEVMPRHAGHFYNWYDTRTLAPLSPAFISTVDSGNIYAGLLVTRQALTELGEQSLSERIHALLSDMDFTPLYDSKRGLFHICFDTVRMQGAGGYYDLLASEAMLTSYIAIAKGDVPVRHWRKLSRAQLQKDGYRGLASWTGTMFEYLMPVIFLRIFRGSLLYESARFCVYAQRRKVDPSIPWGSSESAFFSLDRSMNYLYKAHGCAALALKRGQDAETVIAPYASFLALAVEPVNAVRNLRRLESFGAYSRRGFIEALDFTSGRCRRQQGEPVRCHMAHHVGMSITAAANAVCAGSISRRFMNCPEMSAFSLLLQERLPDNGTVIRRDSTDIPERQRQNASECWQLRGGQEDTELGCCLLSNGAYSIMSTNWGLSSALFGSIGIYGFTFSSPLTLTLEYGGRSVNLLPCERAELWELSEEKHSVRVSIDGLEAEVTTAAAAGEWGEVRTVTLSGNSSGSVAAELCFEPLLAEVNDYVNHKAFWRLGIEAEVEDNVLLLHRLRRGEKKELWLAVACNAPAEFSADRHGGLGSLSHPFVRIRTALSLSSGKSENLRFALCIGLCKTEAADGAKRLLVSCDSDRGSMVSAAASLLDMDVRETGRAMAMLPSLLFGCPKEAVAKCELWPYGISGDFPLISCEGDSADAVELLKRFCLLKSCGIEAELVYLTDEQGEYRRPLFQKISSVLSAIGLEPLLGSRGGIHFAPSGARELVEGRAVILGDKLRPVSVPSSAPLRPSGTVPDYTGGKEFEYYVNDIMLPRAWQLPLTNGSFGAIAADTGCAAMWYKNAREMALISPADVFYAVGAVELSAECGGKFYSLFAADDGRGCSVKYTPGLAEWEKALPDMSVHVSMFVPTATDACVITVSGAAGRHLHFSVAPTVGGGRNAVRCCVQNNALVAENAESWYEDAVLTVVFSDPASLTAEDTAKRMSADLIGGETSVIVCGTADRAELLQLCKPDRAADHRELTVLRWKHILSRAAISCDERAICNYVNHWCPYQVIACRLEGRSSLYQSGGAYGFRDQLQDAVNFILLDPSFARERISDACRHQYIEGDVQHWWHVHPDGDRGLRTRCSDDLLWLVWALCRYVNLTGDTEFCKKEEYYVNSPVLSPDEHDRYETADLSELSESVLDHAIAAMERSIARGFGTHGLPLIGSGDWNDGLDAAGGESLWLGWFFSCCADALASLLYKLCKPNAERYRQYAKLVAAACETGFNGSFYVRGYLADGSVLGGDRLDSIAQSWAVFCPYSDKQHARAAIEYSLCKLIDEKNGIVKLLDRPYDSTDAYVGYISSYGKGFRENGGQYTHAAVWLALACLELGKNDEAWDILNMLLPENRELSSYEGEPFVLAADVSAASGHEGEAGWTWYTGSAAWYYRAVTEGVFGLHPENGELHIVPHFPDHIRKASAYWTDICGIRHEISYLNGEISVDGQIK